MFEKYFPPLLFPSLYFYWHTLNNDWKLNFQKRQCSPHKNGELEIKTSVKKNQSLHIDYGKFLFTDSLNVWIILPFLSCKSQNKYAVSEKVLFSIGIKKKISDVRYRIYFFGITEQSSWMLLKQLGRGGAPDTESTSSCIKKQFWRSKAAVKYGNRSEKGW